LRVGGLGRISLLRHCVLLRLRRRRGRSRVTLLRIRRLIHPLRGGLRRIILLGNGRRRLSPLILAGLRSRA
jgi:hypothetical protein